MSEVDVFPFDTPADRDCGAIRAKLETTGRLIGSNDLLIAAHAVSISAAVTANESEFLRVNGLQVENWLAWPP